LFLNDRVPFVVSFPKSGRTWLRVMLDELRIEAIYTHDGSDDLRQAPSESLNPDKSDYARVPVLLLVRDVRDTAVSGYFQAIKRFKLDVGSMSQFIRDNRHGIVKIVRFNLGWYTAADHIKRIAILRYEDLHESAEDAIIRVGQFVGRKLSHDDVKRAVANARFEKMQAGEVNGKFAERYGLRLTPADRNDPESYKVRRGIVGGFHDYLSPEDIAYCDQILAQTHYQRHLENVLRRHGLMNRQSVSAGNSISQ
jgi:sulfotransferase family protein